MAEKTLLEEGDLGDAARTIDGDIAFLVHDVGLRANELAFLKTIDENDTP